MRKVATIAAAAALLMTGPAVAQSVPAPVAQADVADANANALRGGWRTEYYLIGALVLALVIWGLIELLDDEEDRPVSP